jgi:hypothetical protein
MRFSSIDFAENLDMSASPGGEPMSPATYQAQWEVEAEMRRLRLELKQTMDIWCVRSTTKRRSHAAAVVEAAMTPNRMPRF